MQDKFGLAHFWAQGDAVTHAVAIVMLLMSVASWTIIIGKAIGHFRNRHSISLAMQSFWDADSRAQALDAIRRTDRSGVFALVATDAVLAARAWEEKSAGRTGPGVDASEFIGRTLQQSTVLAQARRHHTDCVRDGSASLMTFISGKRMHTRRRPPFLFVAALCMGMSHLATPSAMAQDKHAHGNAAPASAARDLGTAAAFDNDGRLWVVTKESENTDQYVVLRSSADMGKTWTPGQRIQKTPEPVAANGEARPHIAIGKKGELYISYTSTIARPHIGNIRFVRSLDGGKSFSAPVTVHANRDHIVHSFESMAVAPDGKLYIAWIDGRGATQAKQQNERYAGSAVYYAVSSDQGESFAGDYKVADHACECCRIGLSLNQDGKPVAMWRHIFAPNIRDHAMAELGPNGAASEIKRVTFDDWMVDACPHHGPSLAFGNDGKRHQVWFTGKEGVASSTLYAAEDARVPSALGSGQTSHPDLITHEDQVAIVWKVFDGQSTAVVLKQSDDGGKSWTEKEAGRTTANSDSPYLVKSADRIVLIWRTQNEGIRVIPVERKKG